MTLFFEIIALVLFILAGMTYPDFPGAPWPQRFVRFISFGLASYMCALIFPGFLGGGYGPTSHHSYAENLHMANPLALLLLVVVILVVFGGYNDRYYNRGYGFGFGGLLFVLALLWLFGVI